MHVKLSNIQCLIAKHWPFKHVYEVVTEMCLEKYLITNHTLYLWFFPWNVNFWYGIFLTSNVGESGANWHSGRIGTPRVSAHVAVANLWRWCFLCCTYTNQNTKNLWRPNPSWFKNFHDKPFLNHMSILF